MELTQLQDWRRLASMTLVDIIPGIRDLQLNALDGSVDDFLRKLVNQPPRPVSQLPYVGLFDDTTVVELRRQGANVVKRFLPELQAPDLVRLDADADFLIRQLRGFSLTRPMGVHPYEGLYGYTVLNVSQSLMQQWRRLAGELLEQLLDGITDNSPTPSDNLADSLARMLARPPLPSRPADSLPFEGFFMLPKGISFPELRRRGADTLRLLVISINDIQLGPKDAVVDDVLRRIINLTDAQDGMTVGDRPTDRLPYEGLFPPDPCTGEHPDKNLLSRNFTLTELIQSDTADRLGLSNQPNAQELANLKTLACALLQPARDALGPLRVTSGFRSDPVNRAVGGVSNSDHRLGYAADIIPVNVSTRDFAIWVARNVQFDQIILEFGTPQNPAWIHVSANPRNRRQILRQDLSGTRPIQI